MAKKVPQVKKQAKETPSKNNNSQKSIVEDKKEEESEEEIVLKKAIKRKIKIEKDGKAKVVQQQKTKSVKKTKSNKKKQTPKKKAKKDTKKKKVKNQDEEDEIDQEVQEFDKDLFLPGQKYPSPAESDGTRIFYETLYQQKPGSKIAEKWCLEYGVLPNDKAQEIFKKYQKEKKK